jgi:hypothetical protein
MMRTATSAIAVLTTALVLGVSTTTATEIGLDICACQPDTITFELKFNFDCVDSNVEGPGIIDSACNTDTRGVSARDEIPTLVSEVQIFELDGQSKVLNQVIFKGPYADGAIITYTSIVKSAPENITAVDQLPLGFQVTISAINQFEETLVNTWIIEYAGNCGSTSTLEHEQTTTNNGSYRFPFACFTNLQNRFVFAELQSSLSLRLANKSVGVSLYVLLP